ncbi:MAG: transcriptional regulator, partial [Alloalcanivorax venustensis]
SCRDTNHLLVAAGHPPRFSETRLDDPAMAPVRRALEVMLENHSPYPAAVLDAHWNLLLANPAQQALIQAVVAEGGPLPQTGNMVELVFHPEGFRPFIANWETVAGFLLRRLRRDLDTRPDTVLRALYQRLSELADVDALLEHTPASVEPMLTLELDIAGRRLRTFSTLACFGTAVDVVVEELRIEHYFPADDATRAFFEEAGGFDRTEGPESV